MASVRRRAVSGARWSVLAARSDGTRVELENEGLLDEVVLDEWLHLESLDKRTWWLRIGDARVVVVVDDPTLPEVHVQRGSYGRARGTTDVDDARVAPAERTRTEEALGDDAEGWEVPDRVHDAASLASFVEALRRDLSAHPEAWENPTLDRFLGAMAGWITDARAEPPTAAEAWQHFARALHAGRTYE